MPLPFSLARLTAIIRKEFVQMRRDRLTFGMMVGIPLMQIILFGFAINQDPRHLPTGIVCADQGPVARALVSGLQNSGYFHVTAPDMSEDRASRALALGELQFVLHIPAGFERRLRRGEQPGLLLEADATDPAATSNALGAFREIVTRTLAQTLRGPSLDTKPAPLPVELRIHPRYNPEARTRYNIVPGLMGVVLTMTMVMITALAMTRERERGTLEMLLATPVRPLEVLVGKMVPYVLVAYIQIGLILAAARLLFQVPFEGSVLLLLAASLVFVAANLGVGVTFSTFARNQLQAVQMAFFFFLPSILLSGFMFPFRGMPEWAQHIGSVLPLTHFLRIIRGILLKGNGWFEIAPELGKIGIFLAVSLVAAVVRYRKTLD